MWDCFTSSSIVPSYGLLCYVESKFDDIVRLHNVIFALGSNFAGRTGSRFGTGSYQVVIIDDLCRNKTFFEIRMDDAGRLRGGGALRDRPSADFFFAGSQIALQAQSVV